MICNNCKKEITTNGSCSYCGYNPSLDGEENKGKVINYSDVKLPQTRVNLLKGANGAASTGFVLSFFSIIPFLWMTSIILCIVGFFKAKSARCGRVRAIIGFFINMVPVVAFIAYIIFYFVLYTVLMNQYN